MLSLKVPLKDAQSAKLLLRKKGVLSFDYIPLKTKTHMFFPINKRFSTKYQIIEKKLEKRKIQSLIRDRLAQHLTKEELEQVKTATDIIGDIAIIELDKELAKKKNLIGEEFLQQNKNIKTILRKKGGHEGELRTQKYEWLAGKKTFVIIHKENNCKLKLDVRKVYYSPRTATERKRIAELIKPGENILVMFSGCAPFVCVIAKNNKPGLVWGIELNKAGHEYGLENIKLNKLVNVTLFHGDVLKVMPKLKKTFDRIIMPLPRSAGTFLNTALKAAKKGTIIHLYSFQKQGEFHLAEQIIKHECESMKRKCKILRIVKAGQNAPRSFRICVDFQLLN